MAKKKRWQPPHPDPLKGKLHRPQPKPRKREVYRGNEICRWGGCTNRRSLQVTQYQGKHRDKPFPLCDTHIVITVSAYVNAGDIAPKIPDVTRAVFRMVEEQRNKEPEEPEEDGDIYYFKIGDLIKIGYSRNAFARLKSYPPTTEWLAVELGTRKIERARHSLFSEHLAHGREWFHPHPDLLEWIQQLRDKGGKPRVKHYPFTQPGEKEPVVAGRRYYMPQPKI